MPESFSFRTIGVVGAGQMGQGIAQVCARHGYAVLLNDLEDTVVGAAMERISTALARRVQKGELSESLRLEAVARIRPAPALSALADCDLVIEAVREDETVKRDLFIALCPHLKDGALIASNTSSISITRLAAVTDRPGRFIGLHFMNPVPAMKLVEVIRGLQTSDETYRAICELAAGLGKTVAPAEDYPAFIVNRILIPMINEAVYTLYEGVGTVEGIDEAIRLGANHPMGPLALADFIGLDVCLSVMQVLHEGLSDSKYRPCPLLAKYVEAGWYGRKSNRGFYDYSGDVPRPTR